MSMLSATLERIGAGGVYMFPILALGGVMFALVLLRLFRLAYFLRDLRRIEQSGHNAIMDSIWLAGIAHQYVESRSGIPELDADLSEKLGTVLVRRMATSGGGILLCASLSTLCGLLGTVSGMISSFHSMQEQGVHQMEAMAAGISEALITTQSGLVIGVCGVILGRFLASMTRSLRLKVADYCLHLEQAIANGEGALS